jgi:GR25 family glycosyltransferase involved in LPS biosynthesis
MIKSYVIHAESAKERKRHVVKLVKLTDATVFPAIMDNPGARGCYLSHIEIYKINPEEPVIVFEDDCIITDPRIIQLVEWNASNYDIIYLGVSKAWSQLLNIKINFVGLPSQTFKKNSWGTYAVFLSPKVKKLVLDHDSKYGYTLPIDLLLNTIINENDLRVFIPSPIDKFVKHDNSIKSLMIITNESELL